uniref:Uncharacterized protein n=1 Tax=Globisporangium ultimum (strain ATCC 200006 / CBS 805.95 / DAOM BR144) TaxID=431595 RepID=K3W4X8_GLOUD
MLTRSRAKAANQPIFVDDQWSDAYIRTKDEQIDALHALQPHGSDWAFATDDESESDDDEDEDVWRSDDEANADSTDDEDEEGDEKDDENDAVDGVVSKSRLAGGALAENVFWTVMTLLFVPLFLYATVLKRKRTPWPLQSASLSGTVLKVAVNLLAITGLLLVFYGAACSTNVSISMPSMGSATTAWPLSAALLWRNLELHGVDDCSASFLAGWTQCLAFNTHGVDSVSPLCAQALVQGTLFVLLLAALGCFHRLWLKLLLFWGLVAYATGNIAIELQAEKRAAIQIFSLDPTFAFANESIFVAIDGQNLAQGGIIAWVPYWGGVQQMKAHKCPKLFPRPLDNGGVLVTFDAVNEFIPCYCTAADAAKSSAEHPPAFRCFEDIKLRVKDQKSVPGWSLHASSDEL